MSWLAGRCRHPPPMQAPPNTVATNRGLVLRIFPTSHGEEALPSGEGACPLRRDDQRILGFVAWESKTSPCDRAGPRRTATP